MSVLVSAATMPKLLNHVPMASTGDVIQDWIDQYSVREPEPCIPLVRGLRPGAVLHCLGWTGPDAWRERASDDVTRLLVLRERALAETVRYGGVADRLPCYAPLPLWTHRVADIALDIVTSQEWAHASLGIYAYKLQKAIYESSKEEIEYATGPKLLQKAFYGAFKEFPFSMKVPKQHTWDNLLLVDGLPKPDIWLLQPGRIWESARESLARMSDYDGPNGTMAALCAPPVDRRFLRVSLIEYDASDE